MHFSRVRVHVETDASSAEDLLSGLLQKPVSFVERLADRVPVLLQALVVGFEALLLCVVGHLRYLHLVKLLNNVHQLAVSLARNREVGCLDRPTVFCEELFYALLIPLCDLFHRVGPDAQPVEVRERSLDRLHWSSYGLSRRDRRFALCALFINTRRFGRACLRLTTLVALFASISGHEVAGDCEDGQPKADQWNFILHKL